MVASCGVGSRKGGREGGSGEKTTHRRRGRREEGGREGGKGTYLVLLVLGHEVAHVAFGLRELHLVHALARVPEGGSKGGRE